MYPHAIRLRGPWEFSFLDASSPAAGTTAIPGFWTAEQLHGRTGPVELRRTFNWVARIEPTEVVWLSIDGCLGLATVSLNDQELGAIQYPWGEYRFDVTALLRPNNALKVRLTPSADRVGDEPAAGILEGVQLVVESTQFAVRELNWTTNWLDGLGDLSIQGVFVGDPAGASYRIVLDGAVVSSGHIETSSDGAWSATLDGLTVDSWEPRSLGKPTLYSLDFSVHSDDGVLFEESSTIGFRRLERSGDQHWRINGVDLAEPAFPLSMAKSHSPNFGEAPNAPFADWSLAAHAVLFTEGHAAPSGLYKLCDRAGILIEQDWTALIPHHKVDEPRQQCFRRRLECHPSVIPM